jgi:hypothetical protein
VPLACASTPKQLPAVHVSARVFVRVVDDSCGHTPSALACARRAPLANASALTSSLLSLLTSAPRSVLHTHPCRIPHGTDGTVFFPTARALS